MDLMDLYYLSKRAFKEVQKFSGALHRDLLISQLFLNIVSILLHESHSQVQELQIFNRYRLH